MEQSHSNNADCAVGPNTTSGGFSEKENSNGTGTLLLRHKRAAAKIIQWEQFSAWPMFILSLVFVGVTVIVIAQPANLNAKDYNYLVETMFILWAVFIADFILRLAISPDRKYFIKTQYFELLTLLVPYLRPFLLLRYIWRLALFTHSGADGIRARALVSVGLFSIFYVYTISTFVWLFERVAENGNIKNFGDAIWWGFTTITTVGYGDYTPVTPGGRILAVFLMVGGIFVVGVTSATMISAFNDQLNAYLKKHGQQNSNENSASKPEKHHRDGTALINTLSMGAAQSALTVQAAKERLEAATKMEDNGTEISVDESVKAIEDRSSDQ